MSVNRITFGCIMLVSTWLLGNSLPFERWAPWILSWIGLSIGLLASLVLLPAAGVLRRSLAIVVDVAGTTILLTAGGEATAFLYVVYHWIIIGNGFRFGGKYTVAGSIVSIAGFSLVISSDSFWREHSSLSLGLLSGLVVLPAYSFVLIRQLTKARQQAERADQAKSLFLASISHELRTPLNAIIGTAELLSGTRLDRAQAEMVATIDTAADGQLSLIQDVLSFSSIEAGQGQVNVAPFDLVALFGAVRAVIAPAVRKKGLLFNCFISARTPLQLLGDERRLREVLLNICSNAVKFTPTGSITLAADGLDEGDGLVQLRFEVVDTGIGIKPEAQARIFELFTQADETVLDRFGGTGLGLALCERQVALMGGSIGVFSLPERGSTFWITLELSRASTPEPDSPPVRLLPVLNDPEWRRTAESLAALFPAADDAPVVALVEPGNEHLIPPGTDALIEVVALISAHIPPRTVRERYSTMLDRHSPPQEWRRAVRIAGAMRRLSPGSTTGPRLAGVPDPAAAAALVGLRVLVADDNAINRSIMAEVLKHAGIAAVFATDGEQALAILTESVVDVALLDVNMPVMTGIELAKLYAFSILGGPSTPLIALTADATAATREQCLQAGMVACLTKPVRTAELLQALAAAAPARTLPAIAPVASSPAPPVAATVDVAALAALDDLGGPEFVARLVNDFEREGLLILGEVEVACLMRDVHLFRGATHSFASISSNMGAARIAALCSRWQHITEAEFMATQGDMLGLLRTVWSETCIGFERAARPYAELQPGWQPGAADR